MLAGAAIGSVTGLGAEGYEFALRGLVSALRRRP
jgi:3-dehydroquinate dehydratase